MTTYQNDHLTDIDVDQDSVVTGMFNDPESAEKAYKSLHERGYKTEDINVVMSDETKKKHFEKKGETEIGTKALSGAGTGSAIGGTLGAIAGAVAAIGTTLLIPGLGLVIAGPVAAALAGAGAGSIAGGAIGALVGSGIPEARAKVYETGLKEGKVVLAVKPKNGDDANYIENQWQTHHGEEVYR